VDHGVTFHPHSKLRTVIWDYAGEPIPPEIATDVARFAQDLTVGTARNTLAALLADDEVDALQRRVETLLREAAYPEPGPGRPYPWPPV
jgi:uncharacterized repeat protein (TIGR03843 family)